MEAKGMLKKLQVSGFGEFPDSQLHYGLYSVASGYGGCESCRNLSMVPVHLLEIRLRSCREQLRRSGHD
jgi:hypothetical protein